MFLVGTSQVERSGNRVRIWWTSLELRIVSKGLFVALRCRMRIALRTLAVILLVTVLGAAQQQKKPALTNEDIVRMVKDNFADSTIVKAIEANHTAFDLSASAL